MDPRQQNLARLKTEQFDVLVIGGGINGAGIARDLTLRDPSIRVALVDKGHFSSGTSGRNSQLIHGGLRYLKYLEFPLVQEALHERATLLKIARPLVDPLQFLIPCYGPIDRWFYGAGLILYDLLAGSRGIAPHQVLSAAKVRSLEPALWADSLRAGLLFYDCKVHSARLTLENILDAEARGAAVANYVSYKSGEAQDQLTGESFGIRAKHIVDATGAWSTGAPLRLVRGSHLVFPRIQQGKEAISYFDEQGRIIFFIPWGENDDFTLVGTTDIDHQTGADRVEIAAEEEAYLTRIVHRLFPTYTGKAIASYSSLRPLIKEEGKSATSTSREHKIWQTPDGVHHIAGGKYTTYRAMAEEMTDTLVDLLRPGKTLPCRTADTVLNIAATPADQATRIEKAVVREYARKLPDLLYISTYWGHEHNINAAYLRPLALEMGKLLGWDAARINAEISDSLASKAAIPAGA